MKLRSGRIKGAPDLPIEVIGLVASFAKTGQDIANICIALGPKDSLTVRFNYLHRNHGYALDTLRAYINSDKSVVNTTKCRSRFIDWAVANASCLWSSYSRETIDQHYIAKYFNEEGQGRTRFCTAQPLSNPAVAIELGMVDVLKALLDGVGNDVNAFKWTGYEFYDRFHLLYLAMLQKDTSCFDYLLSISTINIDCAFCDDFEMKLIHAAVYNNNVSPYHLRALVGHHTCDPNALFGRFLPLDVTIVMADKVLAKPDVILEKTRILLRAGADPTFSNDGDFPSPITFARNSLKKLDQCDAKAARGRMLKKVLHMMEDWVEFGEV